MIKCPNCEEMVNAYYLRRYGMCIECLDKLKEASNEK